MFHIGEGVPQGSTLSSCLFNLYTEYLLQNAGLDESQAGIKITGRNINSLRYADDTTLTVENEEELKSCLMRVKEGSEKSGLNINIQKTKIVVPDTITSWQTERAKVEAMTVFSWAPKSLQTVTIAMKLKDSYFLEGKLWST